MFDQKLQLVALTTNSWQFEVQFDGLPEGCIVGAYNSAPAVCWRWLSSSDVAKSMQDNPGISLVEQFIYSAHKPFLKCLGRHADTAPCDERLRRCQKCFFHFFAFDFEGASSTCRPCSQCLWHCQSCGVEFESAGFSTSQWLRHNLKSARAARGTQMIG